ncbi:claudin-14-like protein [Lates japonicus]|uniref:Claudin-14-like protein n=1 Tax=Lates japonicus TaxID=270547 RepID=A0AAD3NL93_LATJO|nr:claudin-14-like protein [Lates japonicus]
MKHESGGSAYVGLPQRHLHAGRGMLCVAGCEEQDGGAGRRHGRRVSVSVVGVRHRGRTTSQIYRNPTLQAWGINTPSRGVTPGTKHQ